MLLCNLWTLCTLRVMEEMSIVQARKALGEIVDRAGLTDTPIRIRRRSRRAVVVVSEEWYEKASAALAEKEQEQ